ncbi:MAG TPA: hypothetical protein VEU07_05825 [Candidatus Acidoferrum sp.]|nr:hypothetical protein [Candidatus Acidoferrum sp.]
MRKGWRVAMVLVAGLGLLASAVAGEQTQPPRPSRPREEAGTDARMLADLEILRDLELLKQLDLLRRIDEIRSEPTPRPAGAEEKGKP